MKSAILELISNKIANDLNVADFFFISFLSI